MRLGGEGESTSIASDEFWIQRGKKGKEQTQKFKIDSRNGHI